ncbi:MAG: chemotaxis protein CheW [Pseudomonadota bacterium]
MQTDAAPAGAGDGQGVQGKFLTFLLDREQYGIAILKVREIIGLVPITPIPRTPGYVKGVANLRGKVIPVLDLRLKFGLAAAAYDERTCIIVVDAAGAAGASLLGLVVDGVNEVAHIRGEEVEPAPSFGLAVDTSFILGLAKGAGEVKILLDIDQVLQRDEFAGLAQCSKGRAGTAAAEGAAAGAGEAA